MRQGPLTGLRVLEFAGIGPGPFAGMLLSDLGADVVRIDRKSSAAHATGGGDKFAVTERGRRSVALDLKDPAAIEACLKLAEKADALIEGFRPGVMERLGLGPDVLLARNPQLVFGRMTGWGQDGPLAHAAGHDINYIALSGALAAIGPAEKPAVPLNLVGDFGGGALYLAFGLLAGVLHARATGQGQVVDAAMTDGAASLMAMFYGFGAAGHWAEARESNLLDGGAHFYGTYQTSDHKWIALGGIEPQFYAELLQRLGLPADLAHFDASKWSELRRKVADVVATRTRDEWDAVLAGTDVCYAPVLTMAEAPAHPHNAARGTFANIGGVPQPAPAPRFSATPGAIQSPPPAPGQDTAAALADWGFTAQEIAALS